MLNYYGGGIVLLNKLTPWVVDDLLKSTTASNLSSMSDWISSITHFYMHWGGRIWGEVFALLFLSIPKYIFNYINSVGYLILLLLIYFNIMGKWCISVFILLFINFSLFAFLPAFGQDILWISGCANYMWSMLIPLAFLSWYRFYENRPFSFSHNPVFLVGIMPLGILSGWANENVSVGILVILFGYLWIYKKKYNKVPLFAKLGFISTLIGSLLLWLAPGNFIRFAAERHSKSIFHMVHNAIHNVAAFFDFNTGFLLVSIIIVLFIVEQGKHKKISFLYLMGAVISAFAFGVVGMLHSRVWFSCIVFLIVSAGIMLEQLKGNVKIKRIKFILSAFIIISSLFFYKEAKNGIVDFNNRWNENLAIIQQEKQAGNLDIYVNPIFPRNRFCAAYGLDDFKPEKDNNHWLNRGAAKYFGVHTIQSIKVETKK